MQPLNERNLRALMGFLDQAEDLVAPYKASIVEYSSCVVFTNGALLLSWDKNKIDRRNQLYIELTKNGQSDPAMGVLREAKHWTDWVFRSNKMHPVEEGEPEDDTPYGCVTYQCRTTRCHYRTEYISVTEAFLNASVEKDIFNTTTPVDLRNLRLKCNKPADNPDLTVLCVSEGRNQVGAIANVR